MASLMMKVVSLVVVGSMTIAQLTGESTTPGPAVMPTVQQPCTECVSAGRCQLGGLHGSECVCSQGLSGANCDVCSLDCQNAGRCGIRGGRGECKCINATTGLLCQQYLKPANASLAGNVAGNATVFQCKAGGRNINLANTSLWRNHVCYNMSTDNVIIVDLGRQYNINRISVAVYNTPFVNLTIKVGARLADGCDILHGSTCGQMAGLVNTPLKTSVCNHTVTGRYLRVRSMSAVLCLVSAVGIVKQHRQTIARFRGYKAVNFTSQVPPFEKITSVSKIDCAKTCVTRARCLNFRWNSSHCLLYGGPAVPDYTHLAYTWV